MTTRFSIAALALVFAAACGDDTTTSGGPDDDGAGGTNSAGGAAPMGGAGGTVGDRCPEVCVKLDALFASVGCPAPSLCNCKAACADILETEIDCLQSTPGGCSCQGNELDCTVCDAETQASNACWQAN